MDNLSLCSGGGGLYLKQCLTCGKLFARKPREGLRAYGARKFCSKQCVRAPQKPAEELSPGTRYRVRKINGQKVLEHRYVMEQYLGRKLRSDEYVHHINGNKLDNTLVNLEVIDPVAHGRNHHLRKPLTYRCVVCGKVFEPYKDKRGYNRTCGPTCRYRLIWLVRRGMLPRNMGSIPCE